LVGTRSGGLKARDKNLAKNPNHYKEMGKKGGRNGHTGGFASNPELARIAGARGGRISRRRGPSKKVV
jgi:general stress protein YciG